MSPPFRLVEIDGELFGTAKSMTDVILLAAAAGITIHDLDDPDAVRWVGGGKFTWKLHYDGAARTHPPWTGARRASWAGRRPVRPR